MVKRILIMMLVVVMLLPTSVQAKTANMYVTPAKAALRDKQNGKVVKKVKRNTKLNIVWSHSKWTKVNYKNRKLYIKTKLLNPKRSPKKYTAAYFKRAGVIYWGGCQWTWYSQRILPGGGLRIPGRHVDKNGFVCDKDGYIVVAITRSARVKRLVVPTPFGKFGKCYDCGGGGAAWRDIYCNW